jgi:hypothetical protein
MAQKSSGGNWNFGLWKKKMRERQSAPVKMAG